MPNEKACLEPDLAKDTNFSCLFLTSPTWVPLLTGLSLPLFISFPHHVPIPQPVSFSLGLENFFMQYNKRLYLVLMWKLLKIQHYQTLYQLALSYSDVNFRSRNNNAIYFYHIYYSSILVLHFLQKNAKSCLQAVNVMRFKYNTRIKNKTIQSWRHASNHVINGSILYKGYLSWWYSHLESAIVSLQTNVNKLHVKQ